MRSRPHEAADAPAGGDVEVAAMMRAVDNLSSAIDRALHISDGWNGNPETEPDGGGAWDAVDAAAADTIAAIRAWRHREASNPVRFALDELIATRQAFDQAVEHNAVQVASRQAQGRQPKPTGAPV